MSYEIDFSIFETEESFNADSVTGKTIYTNPTKFIKLMIEKELITEEKAKNGSLSLMVLIIFIMYIIN